MRVMSVSSPSFVLTMQEHGMRLTRASTRNLVFYHLSTCLPHSFTQTQTPAPSFISPHQTPQYSTIEQAQNSYQLTMTGSSTETTGLLSSNSNGDGSNRNGDKKSSVTTARQAFEGADASASRAYHQSKTNKSGDGAVGESGEAHQSEGGLLKPIIFGGLDGILTSFAIVAGAAGGNLSPEVVLVLGFSNIFADALSMGVGEFLSSKANNEWILSERAREAWEMDNYPYVKSLLVLPDSCHC